MGWIVIKNQVGVGARANTVQSHLDDEKNAHLSWEMPYDVIQIFKDIHGKVVLMLVSHMKKYESHITFGWPSNQQ